MLIPKAAVGTCSPAVAPSPVNGWLRSISAGPLSTAVARVDVAFLEFSSSFARARDA